MGVLISSQWRLIRPSFWLWTVLGLAFACVTTSGSGFTIDETARVQIFPAILAAALGARLFAREAMGGQGIYLRALPIPPTRLFWIKIGVGFCSLGTSILIHYLFWYSGLPRFLHDVWRESESLFSVPSSSSWMVTIATGVLTFSASSYFANSFERIAASRQAGLPGFFAAIILGEEILAKEGLTLLSLLLSILCCTVALGAAWRLSHRRGVGGTSFDERVLRTPTALDWLLIVPAQIALVLVPLAAVLHTNVSVDVAPYLHISAMGLSALLWIGMGILLLPWTIREIRARVQGPITATLVAALNITGIGISIWRAIRPRGGILRCARCGRRQLESLHTCRSCMASHLIAPAKQIRWLTLPTTPWPVFVSLVLLFFVGQLPGGLRYIHAYEIRVQHPDVEIVLNDQVLGTGTIKGWSWGRRLGPPIGGSSAMRNGGTVSKTPLPGPFPVRTLVTEFERRQQRMNREYDTGPFGFLSAPDYIQEFFSSSSILRFRYRGLEGALVGLATDASIDNYVCGLVIKADVFFPQLEEKAEQLVQKASRSAVSQEDLLDAVEWGDLLIQYLRQQPNERRLTLTNDFPPDIRDQVPEDGGGRHQRVLSTRLREATPPLQELLDEIIGYRFNLSQSNPTAAANEVWEELEEKLRVDPAGDSLRNRVQHLYPYLRALELLEPRVPLFLEEKIREGSPYACIVAGHAGNPKYFEVCRGALVQGERRRDSALRVAAAWALLALDSSRGVEELIASIKRTPCTMLFDLLAHSGEERAKSYLLALLRGSDRDIREVYPSLYPAAYVRDEILKAISGILSGLKPEDYWIWNS